jgi:hypothetical protein
VAQRLPQSQSAMARTAGLRSEFCRRLAAPPVPCPPGSARATSPEFALPASETTRPKTTRALLLGLVHNPSPPDKASRRPSVPFSRPCHDRGIKQIALTHDAGPRRIRMAGMAERFCKSPLHHFVAQLQRDEAAVWAALTLPWSTGPVEGHSSTEADQTSDVRAS